MRILLAVVLCLSSFQLVAAAQSTQATDETLLKAQKALDNDQADEALALLKPLINVQPPVMGLQHELGLIYYRTSKLVEAKKAFAEAIKQDESDRESVQLEGLVLYRLGQQADAIPYLEKVRQWMPKANADATYVLGLCYLNARRYDDARISFAAQFGLAPDSGGAYLLLTTMLRHANLPELAAVQAKKALEISPGLPLAHFALGEIDLFKSDIDQAIVEFDAERALNPNYAPIYDRLGDAYLRLGKLDDAQQSLAKAIALDTSITGAFAKMGKVLLRRQDPKTAIMYLQHAEKMDPDDFTTHALLAQAYHLTGKDDEAKHENDLASKLHVGKQLLLDPGK